MRVHLSYQGTSKIVLGLSSETMENGDSGSTYLKCWKKNTPTQNSVSCELSFKSKERRTFSEKQGASLCLKCMANIWHDSELLSNKSQLFVITNRKKYQAIIF